MIKVVFFLTLFLTPFHSLTQTEKLSPRLDPADTSQFLYEFSMRYVGSSTRIDMNYRYVLEHLAELLDKNKSWTLHIRGHVCCGPSDKISTKRAKKVYNFMIRSGVDAARISFKGYSDRMPLAFPEKTEEDEEMNRRVDFVVHR